MHVIKFTTDGIGWRISLPSRQLDDLGIHLHYSIGLPQWKVGGQKIR